MTHEPPFMQPCDPPDVSGLAIPHPAPFWSTVTVNASQRSRAIDHASNVEYVRWLDRAAELHADSLGYTQQRMLDDGRMWFVARHEIDYLAEAWADDVLCIATWVGDMAKTKSWRQTVIVRPADERIVCRAGTLWVLVDLSTRRPMRIPSHMCDDFAPLDRLKPPDDLAPRDAGRVMARSKR